MNIGIFTETYYPQINGVVTSIRMLEQELNRLGHKVYIFTTSNPDAHPVPRVFRLPSMPFVFLKSHRVAFLYSPKLLLKMKRFKLDVVHTQTEFPVGIFGKLVSEFYKIPSVHTYHTMYEDYVHYIANGHLITPKMAQRYSRIFCNRANIVIAPSEKTRDSLISYGVRKPIRIIPTGLSFAPFAPDQYSENERIQTKQELGLSETDPVILFVGRVAKEKSVDVLIHAMPELLTKMPRAKLLIIGDGPVLEDLKALAAEKGVEESVVFGGSKPWDHIGEYYRIGDVFVTASTSETQGLTYIEAMASRVPVLAKKDKSTTGIEHGRTGFYFENDEDLPDMLFDILSNPERNKQIVQNGWESIQHLSSEQFGNCLEKLYLEVIQNYTPKKQSKNILQEFNHAYNTYYKK